MANYFKNNNYFEDYCDFSIEPTTGQDPCQARNDLFNTVYTVSNTAFCVCTFLFGILGDRFGSRVTFR